MHVKNSVLYRDESGNFSNIIQQAKKKAEPAIALIKEHIMDSPVVGFDESGCYLNKRLDWSWIAQTVYYTLVFRANGRSGGVLEDMFGDTLLLIPLGKTRDLRLKRFLQFFNES